MILKELLTYKVGGGVPIDGTDSDIQGFHGELKKRFPELNVTSALRKGNGVGKAGSKSRHNRGQAMDIAPNSKIKQFLESQEGISLMNKYKVGFLDETDPATMKKTGATGAHYHIGKDSTLVGKHGNSENDTSRTPYVPPPDMAYINWQNPESSQKSFQGFDFSTLPAETKQTVLENQKLEQDRLNQELMADKLKQENLAIEQELKQKQTDREQMINMLPQAEYIGSNLKRNPYTELLQNQQVMQKGGAVNAQGINSVLSAINPKNWFKEDYSQYETYGEAYQKARNSGDKEFMYKGKRYNSKYKGTPQQQLKETGITDSQIHNRGFIEKRMGENMYPFGYGDTIQRVYSAVVLNEKAPKRKKLEQLQNYTEDKKNGIEEKNGNKRLDAHNLYVGLPQKNNTFGISQYKPSKQKDKNIVYYNLTEDLSDMLIANSGSAMNVGEKFVNSGKEGVMGNYTISKGQDTRGTYMSYYDKWDLEPGNYGKPFEIYDRIYYKTYEGTNKRMYYTDDELKKISLDDVDVLNLQKELMNRGYKLPNSTKSGKPDGKLGKETQQAFTDWQSKNKK